MSDSFTRKIIAQAEELKQTERAVIPDIPQPPQHQEPPPQLGKADPFSVWFRVAFASNKKLMVLLLVLSSLVYAALLPVLGAYDQETWVMVGIGAGGILLVDCLAIVHFLRYRNWRSRLPFQLSGWSELVLAKPLKRTEWRQVTITLQLDSILTTDQKQAYQAAVEVFAHAASRRFYSTDFMDQRKKWEAGELRASGSANTAVTFELYRWCSGTLTRMHQEIGGLKSVVIETGKKSFVVSMPNSDI